MEGGNKVSVGPSFMANRDIRQTLLTLARAMTTQLNRDFGPRMKDIESSKSSRLKNYFRINHFFFFGSKAGEYPQAFLEEVYKIVHD